MYSMWLWTSFIQVKSFVECSHIERLSGVNNVVGEIILGGGQVTGVEDLF